MIINAVIPSVGKIRVRMPQTATVKRLKEAVCRRFAIQPELTVLLLEGRPLKDGHKLKALDLGKAVVVDYLWARQLILWNKKAQERIRSSSVLLVGAGAIGNEVAKNLAMLGVGRMSIVDNDRVELSNVSRMVFFGKKDVGKQKAEALAKNLRLKYPFVDITAFNRRVEDLPLKEFLNSDLIISGLDNVASRIYLSEISRKYQIPLVDGGLIGHEARVQVHIPPEGPCPSCIFPSGDYARLVGLRNPCDAPVEEGKVPSLPTTVSYVSAIVAQEALKILLGYRRWREFGKWPPEAGEPLRGIFIADLKYGKHSLMPLKQNPECIVCGKNGLARQPVKVIEVARKSVRRVTSNVLQHLRRAVGFKEGEVKLYYLTDDERHLKIDKATAKAIELKAGDVILAVHGKDKDYRETLIRIV